MVRKFYQSTCLSVFSTTDSHYRKSALDASECISEGWNLIKPNYGLFIGMIVVQIIVVVIGSLIPYAGDIISIIVSGALTCGIYMALLTQRRGETPRFQLMFEGFSRVGPTTILALISAVPWFIFCLVAYKFFPLPELAPSAENAAEMQAAIFNRAFVVPLIMGYSAVVLSSLVLHILLFFALPLVADRNATIGAAIKSSVAAGLNNIGGLIALLIFQTLFLIAGALACGIGIIFVLPLIYASNIFAYKSVFLDEPQFNNQPPQPDAYDAPE